MVFIVSMMDPLVNPGPGTQRGWNLRERRVHGHCVLRSCLGYEQKYEKRSMVARPQPGGHRIETKMGGVHLDFPFASQPILRSYVSWRVQSGTGRQDLARHNPWETRRLRLGERQSWYPKRGDWKTFDRPDVRPVRNHLLSCDVSWENVVKGVMA